MAIMLRENQSTEAHLNAVRRHIRLCGAGRSGEGRIGEGLVAAIKPVCDELEAKGLAARKKTEERQNALDTVLLREGELDDAVRTAFEDCVRYDRANEGRPVLTVAFPDGKFGPILAVGREAKPAVVEQLAMRIESLGAGHPLQATVAALRAEIAESLKSMEEHRSAVVREKKAATEEELARAALRRQYERNYLTARNDLGKHTAERLFPRINLRPAPQAPAETPAAA